MEYRMYFFVPYNISDIQKGIQAGHAVEQYANKFHDDPNYQDYVNNHKTWIILNGGTTNNVTGTLNQIRRDLIDNDIKFAEFREPDLNDALTALCFLVSSQVYESLSYDEWAEAIRNGDPNLDPKQTYESYIGGLNNMFLKELITDKKLA